MKIYVTRHGQVLPKENYGNVQFPAGDPPLTEIGRQQAALLGKYLHHIGFGGKIYASPYARTLETAERIAEETGSEIIPWAPMREIMKTEKAAEEFCGMRIEEMKKAFPHIVQHASLPYPWWEKKQDSNEDVLERVSRGFEELSPQEDVLFVGHGASAGNMIKHLGIPPKQGRQLYNCSLSVLDTEHPSKSVYMDVAHLPYKLRGANALMLADVEKEQLDKLMAQGIDVSEAVRGHNGTKVLHIGDTSAYTYPYYQMLIEKTQPDVIIHTGDVVDDVKAGRMIGTKEEYTEGVMQLAAILKNSGAEKIYVVPGNNDLTDVLESQMPFAEIVAPDTQMNLGGVICTLAHMRQEIKTESQWYLYGHGLTGEPWTPEKNHPEGTCYFNVMWGANLFLLPERKVISFQRPEEI